MSRFTNRGPVIKDESDRVDVIFLHPQWSYDTRNISEYSSDTLMDYAVMTMVCGWRNYDDKPGKLKNWVDFPINHWRFVFHASYERIKGSLDRLAEWGIILIHPGTQRGSVTRICYPKRGERKEEFALPVFENLTNEKREQLLTDEKEKLEVSANQGLVRQEPVVEAPKPKPVEVQKPKSVKQNPKVLDMLHVDTSVLANPDVIRVDSSLPTKERQAEEMRLMMKHPSVYGKKAWVRYLDNRLEVTNTEHFVPNEEQGGKDLIRKILRFISKVDDKGKATWSECSLSLPDLDLSVLQCPRCGRYVAKDLFNADNLCAVCVRSL